MGSKVRQALLQYLLNHPHFVSGEELSRKLNISRTAVWKHVEELRREGYQIKAVRKQGYLLVEEPQDLSPSVIATHVATKWLGKNVQVFDTVTSTQDVAQRLAKDGAPSGTVIVADQQEAGKGRLGRSWHSPPKTGLWLSFILRPNIPLHSVPQLTLLTAVAVMRAVQRVTALPLSIKWPNDLLIRGKKVAGILLELNAEADQVHFVIVGIGLNVNQKREDFPASIREKATSLALEKRAQVSRKEVIIQLLNEWEALYDLYLDQGFAPIKRLWEQGTDSLGKRITARTSSGQLEGIAIGINGDGALLLKDAEGKIHKIYSADIEQ